MILFTNAYSYNSNTQFPLNNSSPLKHKMEKNVNNCNNITHDHHDHDRKDNTTMIYRSKLPDIYIPNHMPLHSYCFENISKLRTRPCLIDIGTEEVYTYEQVERLSQRVAFGLLKHGIRQYDTIMLLLPNLPEFVFAFLGASYIGVVSTMANPYFTPAEVIKQVEASGAKLIITQSCYVEKVKSYSIEKNIKVICTDTAPDGCIHFSGLTTTDHHLFAARIHPDDVVALPFSSGTTGLPKGVMLTHKGLVTGISQQMDGENPNLYFHENDAILCVLPLFHIYSLFIVLLCGLRVGASIVLMRKFDLANFLEVTQKHKVTIVPLVPPIVLQLAKSDLVGKYDLSSVRMVMSAAAPLGKELENAVRVKFPNAIFGQAYGMTEAGPVVSMCSAFAKEPFGEIKLGSCGAFVRNAEMKIVDIKTGASLGPNQSGEICIRGEHIMKGYLNDPESTACTIDIEGWLHTGDVGYIDKEGEMFIVDRLKEIIKYKGFQVAPAELEALLVTHPYISDAAVVPMRDEVAGEVPVAFVVKRDGIYNITEDEIKQFISKQVVFYKRIHRVVFVDSIPNSPSGKIVRKDLRARLEDEYKN